MSPTLKSTAGWVTFGPNLGVFPSEQTRHVGVAKSERPKLTDGEIISENSNLCDHNSPTSQVYLHSFSCGKNRPTFAKVTVKIKWHSFF